MVPDLPKSLDPGLNQTEVHIPTCTALHTRRAESTPRDPGRRVSVDLKDAYLAVPIAEVHRKYLHFNWRSQTYEFQCLSFGLLSTPRVFTKIMRPVMAISRRQGIRCVTFIDDILLMASSREELGNILKEMISLLELLGFSREVHMCTLPEDHLPGLHSRLAGIDPSAYQRRSWERYRRSVKMP